MPYIEILGDYWGELCASKEEASRWADELLDITRLELAERSPCDPKTLTRAAREYVQDRPVFALEAGMLALRWLLGGYGYEIRRLDVWDAYHATMDATAELDAIEENRARIRRMLQTFESPHPEIAHIIETELQTDERDRDAKPE